MRRFELRNVVRSVATIPLLALATLLCGCQKPDPYAKLEEALAQFEAALQRPAPAITQAEFVEHVANVRTEWNNAVGKGEPVAGFSDGFLEGIWEHLDYSRQTDDFSRADITSGETSVFDLREYLNRLRDKEGLRRKL